MAPGAHASPWRCPRLSALTIGTLSFILSAMPAAAQSIPHVCVRFCNNPPTYLPPAIDPAYSNSHFAAGIDYIDRGDYEAAIDALTAALAALPGNPIIVAKLRDAERHRAVEINDQGTRLHNAGNYGAAIEKFRAAARMDPALRDIYLEHARTSQRVAAAREAEKRHKEELRLEVERFKREKIADEAERSRREASIVRIARLREEKQLEQIKAEVERGRAVQILRGIQRIEVPAPLPPETVRTGFRIAERFAIDKETAAKVWGRMGYGVAAFEFSFALAGRRFTPVALLLATAGDVVIGGLDGAHLYVARETETYERALAYLKDDVSRRQFVDITRRLAGGQTIDPSNLDQRMLDVARSMAERKGGPGATTLVFDAIMSREAIGAALTRAGLNIIAARMGGRVGEHVKRDLLARDRAYGEAVDFLAHAKVALQKTTDREAVDSLRKATALADDIIRRSFHAANVAGTGMRSITELFAAHELEEMQQRR
jgi:tetratricopeptide (TPR) repeat protein